MIQDLVNGVDSGVPAEIKERLRLLLLKHVDAISLNEGDL